MRRAHSLLLGLATVALAGGAALDAQAQAPARSDAAPAGEARGLRYLSWPGRPEPSAPSAGTPTDIRRDLRRPNRVIPHGGSAAALAAPRAAPPVAAPVSPPAPAVVARPPAATPANAWMRRAAAAPPSPAPAPPTEPAPPPVRPAPQPAARLPDYLPEQGGRGQPVPADVALTAPTPEAVQPEYAPSDPMAPRRDAPIFRLQPTTAPRPAAAPQAAPEPPPDARSEASPPQPRRVALVQANPDDRPAPQSSRRYSVHRQNGQAPDALTMPEPTYVDALAVTMTETPASQDLAQPDAAPTLIRDAQGRVRQQPAAPEGDYQ